jgi:hypothetical protein
MPGYSFSVRLQQQRTGGTSNSGNKFFQDRFKRQVATSRESDGP